MTYRRHLEGRVPLVDKATGEIQWGRQSEADMSTVDIGATMVACFMEGARQALIDSTRGGRRR